ncbi:hypothetical protein SARC_06423 [Sphaeroforma arctica JP610]|uniref:Peptidase S74 domain-containing protein n=1 Tax=Sphaeroforma arctica JP610 TaxID=667725 RepID=A0A0L0FZ50_9EUKA|nr:hypothetical protein SARC_06423 [Sphaeroforma arctica JP610]KNC81248.1 hypothetical protein SARC_06423 [Sphaeroforma arctica JP610]|eukprot:XP_014155150.1 hypothetical protein SARC_06423 [Sphaeroforma arctica JP610]
MDNSSNNNGSISVGASHAGPNARGRNSISIGAKAGYASQGRDTIAVGHGAGHRAQGDTSIAIGKLAGSNAQHANTIVLNATGKAMGTRHTNATYMGPIREAEYEEGFGVLAYDTDTGLVVPRHPDLGIRRVTTKPPARKNLPLAANTPATATMSFTLANGSVSKLHLPRLGETGPVGPQGTSVSRIAASPDGRVLVHTTDSVVHDLGPFQGPRGVPGKGIVNARMPDVSSGKLYLDVSDREVCVDLCTDTGAIAEPGARGADVESIDVHPEVGHVRLHMSDGRTVVASGSTFTGPVGERGNTGPAGERGQIGVGVHNVVLDRDADKMTVTHTDGTTRIVSPVRGLKGAAGLHFDQLVVTPQGGLEMHLRAPTAPRAGKPAQTIQMGNVYTNANANATPVDGTVDKGDKGAPGTGIKNIVYEHDTRTLQVQLESHTVIEIPDFLGPDGTKGPDALELGSPIEGPMGDRGRDGDAGPDGGLTMRFTTPYTGDGDFVTYNGKAWANGMFMPRSKAGARGDVDVDADADAVNVYLGEYAGSDGTSNGSVGLGERAGAMAQGAHAVALGVGAGTLTQGKMTVAIGTDAGGDTQGTCAVAIGTGAGQQSQGDYAVAMGFAAGHTEQGAHAVAVGNLAGHVGQGKSAIAVGSGAGYQDQGAQSIAIGYSNGSAVLDDDEMAMWNLPPNTVLLGSSTSVPVHANTMYPPSKMRDDRTVDGARMFYNPTTHELTHTDCTDLNERRQVDTELTDRLLHLSVRARDDTEGTRLGLDLDEMAANCPEFMVDGGVDWDLVRDALETRIEMQYLRCQKV